ncbi:relaxase/mobilization nuclease domain-containing protein [Parasulfitobacter algicola]|uniref:Relaxase/mobilization nuclease domain-containing protein n=1 Tax=Parasulfitobacter algicola TaxID=2614809 RepID=A0ABX2IPK5_9RHOB|nr:relaxase/mobilization nuclease domain-containing protein [Sulfitobacter algicola]NSX54807.1 relaxase/mobilization nuclease domain-containing protein [Sulfitobacter algicola]
MILKGSQRAGASALADHLMNARDNDHIYILELRGFVSNDLHGALLETHAISKATRCQQYMFSLSLNPPQDHIATEDQFLDAANRAEEKLGLSGQPRAIVIHEKDGRRHAHVVWSRIDIDEMKAINLPHFKTKLRDLSRDLFLDHGWVLPDGLATYGNKSPLNFTLEEWQQAKRQSLDPREIKQVFQHAWERCDSQIGFKNALEERGYFLAKGDRRGFVALDVDGNVYAIAKWTGLKAKEVKAKLGSPDNLPSVDDAKSIIRSKVTDQMRGYINQIKDRHDRDLDPLRDDHRAMTRAHRAERQRLKDGQDKRWIEETNARSDRLNKGVRGLFDRLTGKAKIIQSENELDTMRCAKRDQAQRDQLVLDQMQDRRKLQKKFIKLRDQQRQDRRVLARDIMHSLRIAAKPTNDLTQNNTRPRTRSRGPDLSL